MTCDLSLALAWPGFQPPPAAKKEQAGLLYEVGVVRDQLALGLDTGPVYEPDDEDIEVDLNDEEEDDQLEWLDPEDKKYERYLCNLDPNNCKQQDHYKVLGLKTLRYKATTAQIRTAYRRKVLHHHPDKRRARGVPVKSEEEDYFTCITKAYETLGHRQKRRSYDSIDPKFDASTPSSTVTEEKFFDTFGPVFERNGRWSKTQPAPKLGSQDGTFDQVNEFYAFWFDFDSWREFSYLDEEDKEKGENREERRWIDKQNKSERDKRRKEEVKRIRALVELAYSCDPRVGRFKAEEKRKKDEEKEAKKRAKQMKREEELRARREAEEAQRQKEEAEKEAERKRLEEEKKERQAKNKIIQKQRKLLKNFCKENNYFTDDSQLQVQRMDDLTKLCEVLNLEQLELFNETLNKPNGNTAEQVFITQVEEVNARLEEESARLLSSKTKSGDSTQNSASTWSPEEMQLLVKAASLFPVGTQNRWELITEFVNEHAEQTDSKPKTQRDVLNKAKELQKMEGNNKASISEAGLKNVVFAKKDESSRMHSEATQRFDSADAWSSEQQKLFEQALKTYPSSTPDRWDRIAECVPDKSKKECIKRFKELAELVRSKKAAQSKVAATKAGKENSPATR